MIVLGLDASLGAFSAAVVKDGEPLASLELPGSVALEQGLGAVAKVLAESGVTRKAIDRIGVGVGPGSFTGVRIAISYAKSLAQGWRLPLTGVNSFDVIEAGLNLQPPVLCVVRGRTGVVSARFRSGGVELRASGYVNDVLDRLGPGSGPLRVVGETQDVLCGLAERGWSVESVERVIVPAGRAVALVAGMREPARIFHEVRADYGELPAAKIPNLPGALGETPT